MFVCLSHGFLLLLLEENKAERKKPIRFKILSGGGEVNWIDSLFFLLLLFLVCGWTLEQTDRQAVCV